MAKSIMEKIAQMVGEPTTTPAAAVNTEAAAAPNLIQSGNADMTADDDKKVEPLPGAEGTLNSILEAVVARAEGQGAASDDLVNGDSPASAADGARVDAQEKAAAVSALVEAGCDFESAVSMVKEAEEAIQIEEKQQEKVAAITELCASGYDFDTAVEMVKKAEEELTKGASETTGEEVKVADREQEKQAAFNALIEAGVDFDQAISMIKQAEIDVYGETK